LKCADRISVVFMNLKQKRHSKLLPALTKMQVKLKNLKTNLTLQTPKSKKVTRKMEMILKKKRSKQA
jgi:hypothetical protein